MRPLRLLLLCLLATLLASPASAADPRVPAPSHEAAWPLQPRPPVVRGFDPPETRWGAGHRGVDLRGRSGQPVHAALAGQVTFAAPLAGRGVVVVDHGAFRTTYEPVEAGVVVGQQVGRGEVLGTLRRGGTHCPPGACLHWGMRVGDAYLDPLTLVGAGPIRLLPLSPVPPGAVGLRAALPLSRLVVTSSPHGPTARAAPARGGVRAL